MLLDVRLYVSCNPRGHSLTCRFGIPQYPFVYKTSELQEMAGIVSWETSPRFLNPPIEAFFLAVTLGTSCSLFFSGPTGTRVCPGTRPDLYLAPGAAVFVMRVREGHIWCVCTPPTAAPLFGLMFSPLAQAYLSRVSEMRCLANSSWLDNIPKTNSIVWEQMSSVQDP